LQNPNHSRLLNARSISPFTLAQAKLRLSSVAVKLFNGLVTLEIQRRQNSAKAKALVLQMADMLGALLVCRALHPLYDPILTIGTTSQQLHFVEDPTLQTEDGVSVAGRIQILMSRIKDDITQCGNLLNKYHAHSLACVYLFIYVIKTNK
jgi:hypothetical protein